MFDCLGITGTANSQEGTRCGGLRGCPGSRALHSAPGAAAAPQTGSCTLRSSLTPQDTDFQALLLLYLKCLGLWWQRSFHHTFWSRQGNIRWQAWTNLQVNRMGWWWGPWKCWQTASVRCPRRNTKESRWSRSVTLTSGVSGPGFKSWWSPHPFGFPWELGQ